MTKELILESNLINFAIMALIMIWALVKFIPSAAKNQSELLRRDIKEVEEARKLAEMEFAELEAKLKQSKLEANKFIEEAKATAQKLRSQILEESKAEIDQMKLLAEKDIEQQKNLAMQSIRAKVIEAAFKLTEESVKSEDNRAQIEASIRNNLDKSLGALSL